MGFDGVVLIDLEHGSFFPGLRLVGQTADKSFQDYLTDSAYMTVGHPLVESKRRAYR
jgi:hypothetical protein